MKLPTIHININGFLRDALIADGKEPSDYMPAYNGESVALDLYNASSEAIVFPAITELDAPSDLDQASVGWLPSSKKLIPTGLRTVLPVGWGAFVWERGAITKTPLLSRAGVIDPGYSGEIFVNAVNIYPHYRYVIEPLAKTPFQLVFSQCNTNIVQISAEEFDLLHKESSRKIGKIGSSD